MKENYSNTKNNLNSLGKETILFLVYCTILLLFGIENTNAQTTVNITATGAGTWTVPCGVTSITVEAWGAGGTGGGSTVNNDSGDGGGSGAYTSGTFTVTPGSNIAYYVGRSFNGGTGNGADGEDTTILGMNAGGGQGGNANGGSVTGTGGVASGGTTNTNGNNGGAGGTGTGGDGGDAPNGGAGGNGTSNANGQPGTSPGGGGGGGERSGGNRSGGRGGSGQITLTYTDPYAAYCVPTATTDDATGITNVTFNTINNTTTGTAAYSDFHCTQTTTVMATTTHALSVNVNTAGAYTVYVKAWIDWNNNGLFTDAGEEYDLGSANSVASGPPSGSPLNITIPVTPGDYPMRVRATYNTAPTPCNNQNYSEAEDYMITVTPAPVCSTPTAILTALNLVAGTPSGTAINGTFTAAAPAPDGYLVVMSTTNTPPTITDGTTYTIGGSAGVGYTVVDTDSNTSFTATGLNPSTTYYFFVYSMNSACSGGPLYNNTPLTGNQTTGVTLPTYCTPTTANTASTRYIDDISFLGMLNGNTYNLNTGFSTTPNGYQDWTGLAIKPIQAQGGGVNVSFESNSRGTWKAWVDWNKDGDFTDAGEEVYTSGGVAMITNTFGFIVPNGATPGDYRMRIRTYNAYGNYNAMGAACDNPALEYYGDFANHFDSCTQFTNYTVFLNAGCGGANTTLYEYGEAEDYLFTVIQSCDANILTVTDGETCGIGTVDLAVTGSPGVTQYHWYDAETGGSLIATTTTGTWTTPSLATTTSYWVTADNGHCESLVRTEIVAKVGPLPTMTFTPSTPEVCGENNVVSITVSGDTEKVYLIDEGFDSGTLGVFTNDFITSTAYNSQSAWQIETSTYIPNGSSWYPAISSNFGADYFALVTSDIGANGITIHNALLSPVVNSNTFLDLTLKFRMYYSRYYPDTNNPATEYMQVEVSTNGGGSWTSLIGPDIIVDQGIGTDFQEYTYDMSAYINQPNLRVRIRYYAGDWFDGAAVDDIELFGTRPLATAFDWSSGLTVDAYQDAACTIPYVELTPAVTVYVKPTLAQLELPTFSFTASAVLSNGCSVSDNVSIDNKSRVWKGTNSNDWNDPNNWSPNTVPDITTCVIIPDVTSTNPSHVFGGGYDAYGKTLQVKDNGNLQVVSGNTLTIQNFIEVSPAGTFLVENSASLIQIDNVANTGTLLMDRFAFTNSTLDYVYWSTPVAGYSVNNITPTASTYRYRWIPTVNNGGTYAGNFGNWTAASGAMVTGKGYIKRGLSGMTRFSGVPNNGDITTTISRSDYAGVPYAGPTTTLVTEDDDNWNLLGNPYPSAISADAFLAANSTNLEQFVKIWLHGIDPSSSIADPFYQNYVYNYSLSDYLTYNAFGGSMPGFDGYIGAGQGFFTLMRHTSPTMTSTALFNNSMRSNTYRNDQFYRSANTPEAIEKHRIWLKLVAPNSSSSDALVGYASEATNGLDDRFDAISGGAKANFEIYSLINNKEYAIQARSLPFDDQDQIPLGIVVSQSGLHTIALTKVDGIFLSEQAIYLEDLELGVIHDIKSAPYTFGANTGRYNNRFVLRFTNNNTLLSDNFESKGDIFVYTNEAINVSSQLDKIEEVTIFDTLGRVLYSNNNVNNNSLSVHSLIKSNSALIVKAKLDSGITKSVKIIF
ncbi:MAG: GEVED domain-containing protein [Flavobacterium sp.]|nr:GEVED domain-containing protein [Flavobacterium sp.]